MFCLNLLYLFTFCTCFAARDPPIITIPNQGMIMGKEVSRSRVQKIIGYHGIPYAQPPLDNLRFSPPSTDPLPAWEGIRNGTEYQPACLQSSEGFKEEALPFFQLFSERILNMQEDCLYLNVFVPYGSAPHDGFATIVWLHPGNFTTGAPSMWNPHTLVYRHRIIVVTVAFRLNVLGFFTTMDGEAPGNYGLMDQQAALQWVKENIKYFGGNPNNICLMGYGSGGISVGLHMINANSRDFFNKAIVMSANFLSPATVKYPQEDKLLLDKLADNFACIRNPTSQLIDCLRRADGTSLVRETAHVSWRPLIDTGLSNNTTPFLMDTPKNSFEKEDFAKIPFLTGYTDMENILSFKNLKESSNVTNDSLQQILSELISGDIPNMNNTENCVFNYDHINDAVMFFYGPSSTIKDIDGLRKIVSDFNTEKNYASSTFLQATYLSKDQSVFVYRFDMKPITSWAVENVPEWVSVPHLFDLIYVWGLPYWAEFDDKVWELRDKRIVDIIMSFWTNFAKSSDPTEGTLYPIKWEKFTKSNPGILIIDGTFNMSNTNNLNYKAFEFWNDFYPKVVEIATQCCNATDSALNVKLPPLTVIFLNIYFIYLVF